MCGSDCLKSAPHPLLLSREIRSNTRKDKIVDREGFLDPHLFAFLIWIFFLHSPLLQNFLFSSPKHISSLLSPKFISSLTKYFLLHQIYSHFYHIFIWNYSFTTFNTDQNCKYPFHTIISSNPHHSFVIITLSAILAELIKGHLNACQLPI